MFFLNILEIIMLGFCGSVFHSFHSWIKYPLPQMWMWHPSCSTWNQKDSPQGREKHKHFVCLEFAEIVFFKTWQPEWCPQRHILGCTHLQRLVIWARKEVKGDKLWPKQFPPCCLLQDNKRRLYHALTGCSVSYKNPNSSIDFGQPLRFQLLPTFLPFTVVVTLLLGGIPAFSGSTL